MANVVSMGTAAATTGGTSVTTSAVSPTVTWLTVITVGWSDAGPIHALNGIRIVPSVAGLPNFVPVRQVGNGSQGLAMFVCAGLEVSGASRTYQINFPFTTTGTYYSLYRVSQMERTGLGAVRQVAFQNNGGAGATPAPVFPAACLSDNPCVAFICNATNPAAITPPTGFTETLDTGYATPTSGFENSLRVVGNTVTTLTFGSTSATTFGALAVEFDTRPLTANDVPQQVAGWGGM